MVDLPLTVALAFRHFACFTKIQPYLLDYGFVAHTNLIFCFVSGKITKTIQWNQGHTFAFRLLCLKPEVQGRMAPMFPPAHNRKDMRAFRISPVLQPNIATSVVSGGLEKMYKFVFRCLLLIGNCSPMWFSLLYRILSHSSSLTRRTYKVREN